MGGRIGETKAHKMNSVIGGSLGKQNVAQTKQFCTAERVHSSTTFVSKMTLLTYTHKYNKSSNSAFYNSTT